MARSGAGHAPLVDPARVRDRLRAFARIGYRADGGMYRLAFSRDDLRARQLLVHLMENLGLAVRVDAIGNVFGRLPDADQPALPPLLIGSHLDTVPGGGRFDGSAGVVAALEVAAALRAAGCRLARPLEIVSFACEESSRFGRATIGSGVVAGVWDPGEIVDLRDASGTRLGQVLRRLGLDPTQVGQARRAPGDVAAYLELHIEQGRVLEESGTRIGVVDAIAAPTRVRLRLMGRADHSGATPMSLRRDALTGAAEVILAVERRARAAPGVVGTVGLVRVEPNVMNVVPGQVELGIDVRGTVARDKARVVAAIEADIARIASARSLEARIETLSDEEPVRLDAGLVALLERLCAARGIPAMRLPSGAGHDAMQMAKLCPSAMLLVPSRGGISHNRDEWTDPDDIVAGSQILLDAALELAGTTTPLPREADASAERGR